MILQKSRIPIIDILFIGLLPCFLKKTIYRLKGYKIGKKCSIGFGSVICAKNVTIGNHTEIGFFTIIRGNSIKIGSHVKIGSTTFLDTPIIVIGDECKINEQVFVGGLQLPDSKFIIGSHCQIMQLAFINPAVSFSMGNGSGIGGDCLIFGHTSWNSQFEGYPVEFAPIEIGDNVSLAWRVFVMPGVKIGNGSVIAPNSFVNREIPPKCLAAGYPVRIISKYPDFPISVSDVEKIDILKRIECEMIKYFKNSGLQCDFNGNHHEILHEKNALWLKKKTIWKIKFRYDAFNAEENCSSMEDVHVFVSLKSIPKNIRLFLNSKKTMWLDIQEKERPSFWNNMGDETALFLRRYGVKFNRVNE